MYLTFGNRLALVSCLVAVNLLWVKSKSVFKRINYDVADEENGCTGGILFRGECYLTGDAAVTWDEAAGRCERAGAILVMPEKWPVLRFLNNTLSNESRWVGMLDVAQTNKFTWIDGRDVERIFMQKFGTALMSSNDTDAGCVTTKPGPDKRVFLHKEPCSRRYRYICQKATAVDPIAIKQLKELEERQYEREQRLRKDIFTTILQINEKAGVEDRLYQGDIGLSPAQMEVWRAGGDPWAFRKTNRTRLASRQKRGATSNGDWIWPNGEIVYEFDTSTQTPENILLIRQGMANIESRTCIQFIERTTEDTYIIINSEPGCSSQVGMYPGESYAVKLGPSCTDEMGRMQHELMHAIGFYHEQARHDRDDWVEIHLENVTPGRERNFDIITTSESNNLGFEYDYDSTMHYGPYAFSKDVKGGLKTITTLRPPDADIGQRDSMSDTDVAQINKMYNCPTAVDGAWGAWASWGSCTVTCGGGTRERMRQCNKPPPSNGGQLCPGSGSDIGQCMTESCPLPILDFSYLGCWTDVNTPEMLTPIEGESPFLDGDYINRTKKVQKCANAAQAYGVDVFGLRFGGKCLILDEKEDQSLYRSSGASNLCSDGFGVTNAMDVYQLGKGLVDGQWGVWGTFSTCSETCGLGSKTRSRQCNNPVPKGGQVCQGLGQESQDCNLMPCPVDGGWSSWSAPGQCSVTCGQGGTQTRTRTCTNPTPADGGEDCPGSPTETTECNPGECPVHGNWATWGDFGSCSVTCGSGDWTRIRTCTNSAPANAGDQCEGSSTDTQPCTQTPCSVDGGWSPWSTPGSCSVTCGTGTATQTRTCTSPAPALQGANCAGSSSKSESCSQQLCPVDGGWSAWSITSCDRTCGGGRRTKTRTCTNPTPVGTGRTCDGAFSQVENCNTGGCPVDGGWSTWSIPSACTVSCGTGTEQRSRTCTNPSPENGGQGCLGASTDSQTCNTQPCPVDGTWSSWSDSPCSVTCGQGNRVRTRKCDNPAPAFNGADCAGEHTVTGPCSAPTTCPAPVAGGWSSWSTSACSTSCGPGILTRTRTCNNPVPSEGGADCQGNATEADACDAQGCPIDGGWSAWSEPTACSVSCGTGTRTSIRQCNNPVPSNGGLTCSGDPRNTETCTMVTCNPVIHGGWSGWSPPGACSQSCGGGMLNRTRTCTNPAPANGGNPCSGDSFSTSVCNQQSCPLHGGWSGWSLPTPCSQSCDSGLRARTRACNNPLPALGGDLCLGPETQQETCNTHDCAAVVHGSWSEWAPDSPCTSTCMMAYKRSCTEPEPANGGADCSGDSVKVAACGVCPVDGQWGAWSSPNPCSSSCGRGTRTLIRQCEAPPPSGGGQDCPGAATKYEICFTTDCGTAQPSATPTDSPPIDAAPPEVGDIRSSGASSVSQKISSWFRQFMSVLTALLMSLGNRS